MVRYLLVGKKYSASCMSIVSLSIPSVVSQIIPPPPFFSGWTSNALQSSYHLNIPVRSSGPEGKHARGYSYWSLVEIWHAANYTKSNVIMYWWTPDGLVDLFAGTDSEFTKIQLPAPTQKCVEHRNSGGLRCTDEISLEEAAGSPLGSCDDPPNSLQKAVSKGLRQAVYDVSIPEALRSPAYDFVKLFSLDTLQLSEIFEYKKNYTDPREAVCRWAIDKKEWIEGFVPPGYPRRIQQNEISSPTYYAALSVGTFAAALIVVTGTFVYIYRQRNVMKAAQLEFLGLLLLGLLLIAIGAIVISVPATTGSCIASIWLIVSVFLKQLDE